ncbi:hypothetical protein [Streptomyces sp. MBT53]|uniref:hypothetical protein n=1 Tax=Streptomyces sp. MBT53 TaxID=1488384 RepID=UPI001913EB3A|nr:hypothetical protein [Streptomyces sp. MBT53]MBK6015140.1 hypothetical protein [Streptomyces sp. MBT53]
MATLNEYLGVEMITSDAVIRRWAVADAVYVGRFTRDITEWDDGSYGNSVVALGMVSYFSLFVHESQSKLSIIDPNLVSVLSPKAKGIVARSRHSLKLFEDRKRGISGQLAYYDDVLLPAHRSRFRGKWWFSPARIFGNDLGFSLYGRRVVGSTVTTTFHMGAEASDTLSVDNGKFLADLYAEYGEYFAKLGARLGGPSTFVASLEDSAFSSRDLRCVPYHRHVFNGSTTPTLNALLTTFRAMMNFVSLVLTAGGDTSEYTVFKIRFLTLYQILVSLDALVADQTQDLTPKSVAAIKEIVDDPTARLITDIGVKPFRNSLMHYLDPRVDVSKLDFGKPLFGLTSIYFPQYDFPTFSALIDACIAQTADALDAWAE